VLMISGLAIPCSDAFMWEAIAQYEWYHLHAVRFDAAVNSIALPVVMPGPDNQNIAHNFHDLCIEDRRGNTSLLLAFRIRNIAPAEIRTLDLALREFLTLVPNTHTPEELTHIATYPTLLDACFKRRRPNLIDLSIVAALQHAVGGRAMTHYYSAKQALHLRNFADCS